MLRPVTERISRFVYLAHMARLSFCFGRAVKAESELQNRGYRSEQFECVEDWALDFMRRVRFETARRWARHYRNGGDIRALKYTREQKCAMRRAARKETRLVNQHLKYLEQT